MRFGPIVLVLALAAGSAAAADLTDPVWTQAPGRDDWVKSYPAQAAQAGLAGNVKLKCAATAAGTLDKCAVVGESPTGEGFGAAALSLAAGMQLRPTGQDGRLIAGRNVLVPVKFDPSILHGASVIGNPDWLRMPTQDEVENYWPAAASAAGGRTVIQCVVSGRGLLEKCAVKAESPTGQGFGDAALAMSQTFLMRPMTVDGAPVGGAEVVIPIKFSGGGGPTPPQQRVRVLRTAPWMAAPTAAQVASAYPHDAIGHIPTAHVVLRCGITTDGRLVRCDTVSEEPKDRGFASAAQTLARDFHVFVDPKVDHLSDLMVDVPFDFRDPSQPAPPTEVYDPLWLRKVSAEGMAKLYPDAATKAGVAQGVVKVNCAVAHDGTLIDCAIQSEDPPGLGFGAAALTIAGVLQMNPWTSQGAPVEGARISLPIRMVMPAEASAASAPSAPAPPAKP